MATILDYTDLTEAYLNGAMTFEEYSKKFNERSKELENKKFNNSIDYTNAKIISNS